MLKELTADEAICRVDFAYTASKDKSKTSYPIFIDGIHTQNDFAKYYKKCATADNYKTLSFISGAAQGIAQFFYLPDDKYLQLCGFYTDGSASEMLEELLEYMLKHFPSYSLYLGFPAENTQACELLLSRGFFVAESSYHDVMTLGGYAAPDGALRAYKLEKADFGIFEMLHTADEDTYWTSERVFDTFDEWNIYAVADKGGDAAGVLMERGGEIYGVDYKNCEFDGDVFKALVGAALTGMKNAGVEYTTFFNDEQTQPFTLQLGFRSIGRYVLYVRHADA